MHPDAARLTALEDGLIALCASDILHESGVALPEVRRHVLALSFTLPVLSSKRLSILSRLGYLPKTAIVGANLAFAIDWPNAIARPP
jgi:hypothetical protein